MGYFGCTLEELKQLNADCRKDSIKREYIFVHELIKNFNLHEYEYSGYSDGSNT